MLDLASVHKNINRLKKNKKIVSSFFLMFLLIFTGFMGMVIQFNTIVSADLVSYSETFEGDSGTPSDSWYTFYMHDEYGEYNVTTDQAMGGTQSWNISRPGSVAKSDYYFNITTPSNYTWVNFSYYLLNTHGYGLFIVRNRTSDNHMAFLYIDHPTAGDLGDQVMCRDDTIYYEFATVMYDTWCNVSIMMNYTTHTYKVWHDNGTLSSTADADSSPPNNGWLPFFAGADNSMNQLQFRAGDAASSAYTTYMYYDNVIVEHNTSGTVDPTLSLSGLTGGAITFGGSAGAELWCNGTGGTGQETMDLSITDGDDDVTWINVSLFDVSDGGANVLDAEDFALYASASESSGYFSLGSFPNGGGNITLNTTTWTGANNPFPISGADHVYLRFKLTVDEGIAATTYNVEADTCKVYIGG